MIKMTDFPLSPGEIDEADERDLELNSGPPPNITTYSTYLNCAWMEDFPRKTTEAISKINQSYYACRSQDQQWDPRSNEPVKKYIDDYIYYIIVYHDGNFVSRLSLFENLEVAELLLMYLSSKKNAEERLALFSTFFYISSSTMAIVLKTLSLMTSLAITSKCGPILECVASWMMEVGIDDRPVLYLAHDVFRDLVQLDDSDKYADLPKIAPRFASILLISIGKMFSEEAPPQNLVRQLTGWVEESPSVCFLPPRSPIFELFKWTITNEDVDEKSSAGVRLHVALLSALDNADCGNQLQVIPQLMALMKDLDTQGRRLFKFQDRQTLKNLTNRFYQFLQMLIGAGCLDQNEIQPILEECAKLYLPQTKFYKKLQELYGHGIQAHMDES